MTRAGELCRKFVVLQLVKLLSGDGGCSMHGPAESSVFHVIFMASCLLTSRVGLVTHTHAGGGARRHVAARPSRRPGGGACGASHRQGWLGSGQVGVAKKSGQQSCLRVRHPRGVASSWRAARAEGSNMPWCTCQGSSCTGGGAPGMQDQSLSIRARLRTAPGPEIACLALPEGMCSPAGCNLGESSGPALEVVEASALRACAGRKGRPGGTMQARPGEGRRAQSTVALTSRSRRGARSAACLGPCPCLQARRRGPAAGRLHCKGRLQQQLPKHGKRQWLAVLLLLQMS